MTTNNRDGYTAEHVRQFGERLRELRNAQPGVQLNLVHLAQQLTAQRAQTFANEALGRRLPVIERTVLNIFEIFPPGRQELLNKNDCQNVAIQLHAFAINVYAVFDNIAWICTLQAGGDLPPAQVGMFKKECKPFLPQRLKEYIIRPTVTAWFNAYGKVYRDSTAHRIPPYLPDRNFTPEDAARWQQLNKDSLAVLMDWKPGESHSQVEERLARHEQMQAEMRQLGRNSLMVALTLTGVDAEHPIYLHPQLLSDWGLVHELVQTFAQAMREQNGWSAPTIPPMRVT